MKTIQKIAADILQRMGPEDFGGKKKVKEDNKWDGPKEYKTEVGDWEGPSGMYWCNDKKKYVNPNKCNDCPECEAIYQVDIHPPRYLRPTDMSW